MKILLLLLVLPFFAGCKSSAPDDSAIAAELVQMGKAEQALRFEVLGQKEQPDPAKYEQLAALDERNTKRLIAIVDRVGWPTQSRFGPAAAGAAWLILQHSPDYAFQARMLPELERLMRAGQVEGQEYALLYDRVEMHAQRPQRYGSQFVISNGVMRMYQAEDPEHLDERRASVGLPPLAEYQKALAEMYGTKVEP
jgi:hypothetical protein